MQKIIDMVSGFEGATVVSLLRDAHEAARDRETRRSGRE